MKNLVKILSLTILILFNFVVNAQTEKKSSNNLALDGYCPVAYSAMQKAVKGNPEFYSIYKGKKYNFAMGDAKKMFDADPIKYLPQYNGYCATALAMGKKMESDPAIFSIYKGKTFLFSNKMAKDAFDKDPEMTIKKADENIKLLTQK
jgi:YHS domain-containing protein